jgi:hypothetical protein
MSMQTGFLTDGISSTSVEEYPFYDLVSWSDPIASDFYVRVRNLDSTRILFVGNSLFNTAGHGFSTSVLPGELSSPIYVIGSDNSGSSSIWVAADTGSGLESQIRVIFEITTLE